MAEVRIPGNIAPPVISALNGMVDAAPSPNCFNAAHWCEALMREPDKAWPAETIDAIARLLEWCAADVSTENARVSPHLRSQCDIAAAALRTL